MLARLITQFSFLPALLYRPGETLASVLLQRRHWKIPLVTAVVGAGIISAGLVPHLTKALQATTRSASPGMLGAPGVVWTINMVAMLVMLLAHWTFQGLVLMAVSRLGPRPLSRRAILVLVPWLWLPLALRMTAHGFYLLLGGTLVDNGLSFLVPRGQGLTPLSSLSWQFLWQWDLFFLWHLILVGVVLYRFARFNVSRAVDGAILYGLVTALGIALLSVWPMPT